jgi:shikimate kinase
VRKNVVLIGMPGAGKSTIGVILAKALSKKFIDTDLLIQNRLNMSLQDIIDNHGYMELRRIEEDVIRAMDAIDSVIATGGSAVYSGKAMEHLSQGGKIVYLENDIKTLLGRIPDFENRGLAKKENQSFKDLFKERESLYRKYGEITIDCKNKTHDDIAKEIAAKLTEKPEGGTPCSREVH